MNNVEIDGVEYHCDYEGNLLLDSEGEPIPASICICAAHGPHECCCGAWDDVTDWDYD